MAVNRTLGAIDIHKPIVDYKLFLCKRDKTTIRNLSEAYNLQYNAKIGTVNEISFDLPAKIVRYHQMVENPSISMIKHRFLFRLEHGATKEYFLLNEMDKSSDDSDVISYRAYSLGYELNDKIIRLYEEVSKNLTEHLTILLAETNWKIGYIDSEFDLKFRSYDTVSSTVLQCVYDLGEKYNAAIQWDTLKREINFYMPDSVGANKGLRMRYGKYLQSLNQVENSEETTTRLYPYGRESLTVQSVNPTGMSYIEDFSYFLYPYEEVRHYAEVPITGSLGNDITSVISQETEGRGKWIYDQVSPLSQFKFSATLKPLEATGDFGLIFNYIDDSNYWFIEYKKAYLETETPTYLKMIKIVDGVESLVTYTAPPAPSTNKGVSAWNQGQTYEIALEIHKNEILFWIDDKLSMFYEHEQAFSASYIGYTLAHGGSLEIRDVFLENRDYTILKHSDHMSDTLSHSIIKHQAFIEEIAPDFMFLLQTRNTFDETIMEREQELTVLQDQYKIILNELDVFNAQTVSEDQTEEDAEYRANLHRDILARRDAKAIEVTEKENVIVELEMQQSENTDKVNKLSTKLASANNFLPSQLYELNDYIVSKEHTNDAITKPEDLMKEGKEVFQKIREPKFELNIDIVNFLKIVECQHDWDKLALGDIITVDSENLKIKTTAKILEIHYNFDDESISLTIANEKNLLDYNKDLAALLYDSHSTSVQVDIDKYDWNLSKENNGKINDIINSKWDAIKNNVMAGYDQKIEMSERGIIVRSLNNPEEWLIIQNGMLAITNDGGDTWKHAITSTGIVGERIYGKIILGVNLMIEDENGIMAWRGSTGKIYDRNGTLVMRMGLVTDQPDPDCFGIILENPITQVKMTDCEGFAITRATGIDSTTGENTWEKIMWIDPNTGGIYSRDMVAERLKIVNNIGDEILNAETGMFDIGFFKQIVTDGKLISPEKLQVYKELANIQAYYTSLLSQAAKHEYSDRDSTIDYDAQSPSLTVASGTISHINTSNMTLKYNTLMTYIAQYVSIPNAFDDELMMRTDEIDRNIFVLRFKEFYDEANKVRNAIEDALKYSGFQVGKFYNNLIIDSIVGFMAIRNDNKYRTWINATHGLAIQKWENGRWVNKLYGDLDGTLTAEGLVTKNLKIVDGNLGEKIVFDQNDGITIYGNNGEEIRLNANEGIAIDVEVDGVKDKRFWIHTDGTLRAKKLIVMPEDDSEIVELPDGSFISDLTVKRVRTLNSKTPQDYINIENNYLKMMTGIGEESDVVKFELKMEGSGYNGQPTMIWGTGDPANPGNSQLKMSKHQDGFDMAYQDDSGTKKYIKMTDSMTDGIQLIADSGNIKMAAGTTASVHVGTEKIELKFGSQVFTMDANGIKMNGTRIDLN